MKFLGIKNVVYFEPKSWWKDDIYWLMKSSCFELFGDEKCGLFLSQEVNRKDDIYWLRKSSCFQLFNGGKYDLFFSQNVDGKMIFTWFFWAFHDIPGPGKYGFSCSDNFMSLFYNSILLKLLLHFANVLTRMHSGITVILKL